MGISFAIMYLGNIEVINNILSFSFISFLLPYFNVSMNGYTPHCLSKEITGAKISIRTKYRSDCLVTYGYFLLHTLFLDWVIINTNGYTPHCLSKEITGAKISIRTKGKHIIISLILINISCICFLIIYAIYLFYFDVRYSENSVTDTGDVIVGKEAILISCHTSEYPYCIFSSSSVSNCGYASCKERGYLKIKRSKRVKVVFLNENVLGNKKNIVQEKCMVWYLLFNNLCNLFILL